MPLWYVDRMFIQVENEEGVPGRGRAMYTWEYSSAVYWVVCSAPFNEWTCSLKRPIWRTMRGGSGMRWGVALRRRVKPTDNVPISLSRNGDKGYPCDLCRREKPGAFASWIRTSESGWDTWQRRALARRKPCRFNGSGQAIAGFSQGNRI